jgi:hypothetical protein
LIGRPWYRNLLFASDDRNGYATMPLPSVAESVLSLDDDRVREEIKDLSGRILEAADFIRSATDSLSR